MIAVLLAAATLSAAPASLAMPESPAVSTAALSALPLAMPKLDRIAGKVIMVDPGHAVLNEKGSIINPGARARRGVWERDVALNVSEKIAEYLESEGAKVILTRTRDNPWRYSRRKQSDNRARAIMANVHRVDAYVRIHCDWNRNRQFRGFTVFYYRWGSRDLAKQIQLAMAEALPNRRDNGLHRRSFVSVTARMPAVLVELGVLSYKPEAAELAMEAHQTKLARAVATGVIQYFTLEKT